MKPPRWIVLPGGLLLALSAAPCGAAAITRYSAMCDASAAVPVGSGTFAVANDEDNVLRVYGRDESRGPLATLPLDTFLQIDDQHPEADIEGATRVGQRIYWITSHGASKKGKARPNRRRLFATELRVHGDRTELVPVGRPYRNLAEDLAALDALKNFHLEQAAGEPPEGGGLNIEGLAARPADGALLIAFRSPTPNGKALVVPLENPDGAINGQPARLGDPILLDLAGLGIRSIEYSDAARHYLIVAGPSGDQGDFRLYRWSGVASAAPEPVPGIDFGGLHPEALVVYPDEAARVQILSDDGDEPVGKDSCKDASVAAADKGFRSRWIDLSP